MNRYSEFKRGQDIWDVINYVCITQNAIHATYLEEMNYNFVE